MHDHPGQMQYLQEPMAQKKTINLVQAQKVEHPSSFYSFTELYMIRKESLIHSNDLITRRISRSFQKIKKMKIAGKEKELYGEYEQQACEIRRSWRKVHDLFKAGSRTTQITQRKIDKMKSRIQKVRKEMSHDELFLARDVDINRVYIRTAPHPQQVSSSQKNIQK